MADLRREIDALHVIVGDLRAELEGVKLRQSITDEEADKRLLWYAALERLALEVGGYVQTGDDAELRDAYNDVRMLHRYISPAVPRERMPRPA